MFVSLVMVLYQLFISLWDWSMWLLPRCLSKWRQRQQRCPLDRWFMSNESKLRETCTVSCITWTSELVKGYSVRALLWYRHQPLNLQVQRTWLLATCFYESLVCDFVAFVTEQMKAVTMLRGEFDFERFPGLRPQTGPQVPPCNTEKMFSH